MSIGPAKPCADARARLSRFEGHPQLVALLDSIVECMEFLITEPHVAAAHHAPSSARPAHGLIRLSIDVNPAVIVFLDSLVQQFGVDTTREQVVIAALNTLHKSLAVKRSSAPPPPMSGTTPRDTWVPPQPTTPDPREEPSSGPSAIGRVNLTQVPASVARRGK